MSFNPLMSASSILRDGPAYKKPAVEVEFQSANERVFDSERRQWDRLFKAGEEVSIR